MTWVVRLGNLQESTRARWFSLFCASRIEIDIQVQLPGFGGIAYAPRLTIWARFLSILSLQRESASIIVVRRYIQVVSLACCAAWLVILGIRGSCHDPVIDKAELLGCRTGY